MTNSHRRGPWSSSEDNILLRLIGEGPSPNWVKISEEIQTRSPKQCRERFYQNLKPNLDHSPITTEEGRIIEGLVETIGRRWADIARQLAGRSDNAVKNWWNGNQNRRRRAAQRRSGNTAAAASNTVASIVAPNGYSTSAANMAAAPVHTHQRNSSMEDLYEAAEIRERQAQHSYHPEHYRAGYVSAEKDGAAHHVERQLPLPTPPSHNGSTYYDSRRPTNASVHHPEPQPAPREYTYQHQQYQSYQQEQQQQEHYHSQYAPSQYQYRPRHVQTSSGSTTGDYYNTRRMSLAVTSPSADSVDHGSAPSLMSDTGSPTIRGYSSHGSSPTLELPPLLNINGASNKLNDDNYSAPALTPTLPSLTGASRSWNDRSAPSSANHSPARATFPHDDYRTAPAYYSRESSAVPITRPQERPTAEVETAAMAIMNLPEYAERQAQMAEKVTPVKGERNDSRIGVRALLN